MEQIQTYFYKITSGLKPIIGLFITVLNFLIFPTHAFQTAFCSVLGASIIDIITKYIAISKDNGGFINAFRTNKLFSKSFWYGTSIKIKAYLLIFIMMGLGYRISPIEQIQNTISCFSTYVFIIIFLREFQSCIENLNEAGYELEWFSKILKAEQFKILNKIKGGSKNDKDSNIPK